MNRNKVVYSKLKGGAQEAFNSGKLAGVMARYGYELTPIQNDAEGADFIAYRVGEPALLIQLKGRPTVAKKYEGKDIWIAFPNENPDSNVMYMVPHDTLIEIWRENQPRGRAFESKSWMDGGQYDAVSPWLYKALAAFALGED